MLNKVRSTSCTAASGKHLRGFSPGQVGKLSPQVTGVVAGDRVAYLAERFALNFQNIKVNFLFLVYWYTK